ncbi:hypothetical protein SELMODRAFT_429563 [Selaginella moellendorffii]|uniref:Uncharacterized protein n=1 Tax=Selaginella moellendorffii TaxID=88036 RepID=D8T6K8_SELML|nr:hypothetical protein SELMODRAFT_429563 [Selaginella moellendorffii]
MTGASKEPAQQYADQMLHYELENDVGKDAVEVRTKSACKESYSGDDRSTPQVLNSQVDDWTKTTTIVEHSGACFLKKKEVTKIVEMKMMMLNMKSQYRQQMTTTGKGHINQCETSTAANDERVFLGYKQPSETKR